LRGKLLPATRTGPDIRIVALWIAAVIVSRREPLHLVLLILAWSIAALDIHGRR
jgi:hypothetical protein